MCRRSDRCLENINRRATIPLFQIDAAQPAKRGQPGLLVGERIPNQALVAERRIAPASFALRQLCVVDVC